MVLIESPLIQNAVEEVNPILTPKTPTKKTRSPRKPKNPTTPITPTIDPVTPLVTPKVSKRVLRSSTDAKLEPVKDKPGVNKGEEGENITVSKLLELSKSTNPENIAKLTKLFGLDASQGIELLNIYDKSPKKSPKKSPSKSKKTDIAKEETETDDSDSSSISDTSTSSISSITSTISTTVLSESKPDYSNCKVVTEESEITKAVSSSKADCVIRLRLTGRILAISIKCMNGGKPSVLNHTPRSAPVFSTGGVLNSEVSNLDKLIGLLNDERKAGNVNEEINVSNVFPDLDPKIKNSLIKTLVYFMFEGTGSSKSKNPANSVLKVSAPGDIDTWEFVDCGLQEEKEAYVLSLYSKFFVSLINKNMPAKSKPTYNVCVPWIFHDPVSKKDKGCLHVRLSK